MSRSTALGVAPDRRPMKLAEFRNSYGWSVRIWRSLLNATGLLNTDGIYWLNSPALDELWKMTEALPDWQQAPLVLTFDTGVIPFEAYEWAADMLDEFDRRLPEDPSRVNHVPEVAALLRLGPEAPFFGMWGTSVTDNPFDPWDEEADAPGSGIPLSQMYLLERHRALIEARTSKRKARA